MLHRRAIGETLPVTTWTWSPRDVVTYHLGLGAGAAHAGADLGYVLEERVRPLPTFATLACFPHLIHLDRVAGLDALDLTTVLHGEHRLAVPAPIPAHGSVTTTGSIVALEPKRSGVVITVRQESRYDNGRPAWTNTYAMFARGATTDAPPAGEQAAPAPVLPTGPTHTVTTPTTVNQALLYSLSGDHNPLHRDPETARRGGFDAPILQGLCTLGIAVRACTDELFDGDPGRVGGLRVRFSGVVVPGDVVTCTCRRAGDAVAFEAAVGDRPVLSAGMLDAG